MSRVPGRSLLFVAATLAPVSVAAQGYRARIDLQGQGASFRGVTLDSVPVGQTVVGASGGRETADGFAVRCPGITAYCFFFRPGPAHRGGPVTATADMAAWGFGVRGLSVQGVARVGGDIGGTDVWPGTRPRFQVLEGYAEYAPGVITARAGRMQSLGRLGAIGYDGAAVTARSLKLGLEITGYGGLGLAHAAAIPISNPALDPLDQYQPTRRQWVVGGSVGLTVPFATARVLYQREVDRRSRYFISERSAVDVTIQPPLRGLSLNGGAVYDLATATWGTAEGSIAFARGPVAASIGGRRYRPHFDLWTIWGAFSPVPYHAGWTSLRVTPLRGFSLFGRGERYRFDPSGAETPLVESRETGWRWYLGGDAAPHPDIDLSAAYRREIGPGAASSGFEASATFRPEERGSITLNGARLERPLEFRFNEASVWMIGLRATARPSARISLSGGAARYMESRERPDAAAFDWDQTRFDLTVTVLFGSGADLTRLPPGIPRGRR